MGYKILLIKYLFFPLFFLLILIIAFILLPVSYSNSIEEQKISIFAIVKK